MRRYNSNSNRSSNGFVMRLLSYALTTVIIPFVITMAKKRLDGQHRLLCAKCHRKLQVIDNGKLYCKNCKIIKMDNNY